MNARQIWIAAALFAFVAGTASAQTPTPPNPRATPGINKRQRMQQRRIAQGLKSGQLTPREARRLERGEAKIQREKMADKKSGTVTRAERRKLNRQLNRESRAIHRLKHNRRHQK